MPRIVAVKSAFPAHYYAQAELLAGVVAMCEQQGRAWDAGKLQQLFAAVKVEGRHLALPLERYARLGGLADRNEAWLSCALELGERAVRECLAAVQLSPRDVELFASSTVTGIAVPSLEARLMNRLGFAAHCRRLPLFGLGCAAGAAGIARVSDYLQAYPTHAALLLCVELCSLTFRSDDTSVPNLIATGLFADGAACVLAVGDEHPLAARSPVRVVDTRSVLFRDTERVMGWDVEDGGFRIVLSEQVPVLARTGLPREIREFLTEHALHPAKIATWIAHPGGPAVIDAVEGGLELPPGTLDASRRCLARVGNLSSGSVLVLLEEALAGQSWSGPGLLFAMGPGFAAELVLLQC
jgi:alkylresorcinol/alkylpyrone synthase